MNKSYRLIWSEITNAWTVVSENTKARGKRASGAILLAGLVATSAHAGSSTIPPPPPNQLPTGARVTAGSASFAQGGNNLTITQSSADLITNWQSFNIGSNASVQFVQPTTTSVALNRIIGQDPTLILGKLTANGEVFLINPAGIVFGQSSQINIGALVASTLDIDDSDFLGGNYRFGNSASSNSAGSISNAGGISTPVGGVVAFIAPQVTNAGSISTPRGSTLLVAGNKVTVDLVGDGLITYSMDAGAVNALASNSGNMTANGGTVILTAKAADAVSQAVVSNSGVIQAQTLQNQGGHILLLGDMQNGVVEVSGKLDASAPNGGNGGNIETSAQHVTVANNAKVTTLASNGLTGSWLIDPDGFTIAPSGGNITGATLNSELAGGNVSIASTSGSGSDGNVNVNDTVSWSVNKLTLTATNNVNINAVMTATGAASLDLEPGNGNAASGTVNVALGSNGFTGKVAFSGSGTLTIDTQPYTIITSATGLQGMSLSGNYALGSTISLSSLSSGAGFTPVGNNTTAFTGTFDGLGNTISALTINQPTASNPMGLFGVIGSGGVVRNVGLTGGTVTGASYAGALVGINNGSISNSYATTAVSGSQTGAFTDNTNHNGGVGGLVGANNDSISNSHATGAVTSTDSSTYTTVTELTGDSDNAGTGGLAGTNTGTISNSYATGSVGSIQSGSFVGNVNNYASVGGLVGVNNGTISASYATGNVTSSDASNYASNFVVYTNVSNNNAGTGGLVGYNSGSINNSYATGTVSGTQTESYGGLANNNTGFGGLVGMNTPTGTIDNSYTNGSGGVSSTPTTGSNNNGFGTGGLAGVNNGNISNSYSTEAVNGGNNTGGLVGYNAQAYQGPSYESATITSSYATGAVNGDNWVGGLVGTNDNSIISSYATGAVSGNEGVGGLAGINNNSVISSYATGAVSGSNYVGGLVGYNNSNISYSYALGAVTGGSNAGGMAGINYGTVSNSYEAGAVSGTSHIGGLVGNNGYGIVPGSFWNSDANSVAVGYGLANGSHGLSVSQMRNSASYGGGLTFTTTPGASGNAWVIVDVDGSLNNASGATGGTLPMLASEYSTTVTNAHQLQLMAMAPTASYTLAYNIDASNTNGASNDVWSGGSFIPVGNRTNYFTGTFDGQGHTISNLSIFGDDTVDTGLFGDVGVGGTIKNVGIVGGSVTGSNANIGSLVGANYGTVTNSFSSATVSANYAVVFAGTGGLVGLNRGTISNSYSTGAVSGGNYFNGGLVGWNYGNISETYAAGTVSGAQLANGGLIGTQSSGTILNSHWNSDVVAVGIGSGSSTGATGLTTAQMQNQASFSGFDFTITPVWGFGASGVNSGYPVLCALTTCVVQVPASQTVYIEPITGTSTYGQTPVIGYEIVSANSSGATVLFNASTNIDSLTNITGLLGTATDSTGVPTASSNAGSYTFNYLSGLSLAGTGAAGYTLVPYTATSTSWTVAPASLTVSATGGSRVYGSANPSLGVSYQGFVNGNTVASLSSIATASTTATATSGVGNYAVTASGASDPNYTITYVPGTLTVTPAMLTVTGESAANKIYNGTTAANLTGGTLLGVLNGDAVTLTLGGAFASANAGNGVAVIGADSLGGAAAANYTLVQPTLQANITPAPLTISGETAQGKVYNGSTAATLTGGSLNGVLGIDAGNVVLVQAGNFASVNAGSNIAVSASDSLSGSAAGNYMITQPTGLSANITPKPLTVSSERAQNQVYNGSTAATLTGGTLVGVVSTDSNSVTLVQAGSFASANAGTNIGVTASDSLSGSAAGNYTLTQPTGLSATITPKPLTVTGETVQGKGYDGTTTAVLAGGSLNGVIGTDTGNVALIQTGSFASDNIGFNISVSADDSLSGSAAGNYSLTQPTGLTGDIIPPRYVPPPVSTTSTIMLPNSGPASVFTPVPIFASFVPGSSNPLPSTGGDSSSTTITLNFGAQGTMPILLDGTGDNAVLTMPGSFSLSTGAVSLPLFTAAGAATPQQNGVLNISTQGQTFKAAASNAPSITLPDFDVTTINFTSGDISLPGDDKDKIAVGISPQGVMVVKVSTAAKASLDNKQLTLLALAISRQRLNVEPSAVKAVMIEVQ